MNPLRRAFLPSLVCCRDTLGLPQSLTKVSFHWNRAQYAGLNHRLGQLNRYMRATQHLPYKTCELTLLDHSLLAAQFATKEYPKDMELQSMAFLHDIGYSLLLDGFPPQDLDHERLGADFLQGLGFSERITEGIRNQSSGGSSDALSLRKYDSLAKNKAELHGSTEANFDHYFEVASRCLHQSK